MDRRLNGLLTSRKFWLALIGAISALVLFFQGHIGAEQLTDALVVLFSVLVAAIALEDAAAKRSGGNTVVEVEQHAD